MVVCGGSMCSLHINMIKFPLYLMIQCRSWFYVHGTIKIQLLNIQCVEDKDEESETTKRKKTPLRGA